MNFQPQKVLSYFKEIEKKTPNISGEYIASEKLDGWFVYITYNPNSGYSSPYSSAGRLIPSMKFTLHDWNKYPKLDYPAILIAEAYIPGMEFHEMNGIFNRSIGDCDAKDVRFFLHDFVILTKQENSYSRLNQLKQLHKASKAKLSHIHNEIKIIQRNEFESLAEDLWNQGKEGLIVKKVDEIYYPGKRNSSLMKLKLENEYDLKILGIFTSYGEKGNLAYNLRLENKKGTKIDVLVPKFKDIEIINNNSIDLTGTIVTIKCMKQLEDGSYREPRFKCFRFDKSENDYD